MFNIEEFKAGKPFKTRSGKSVTFLHYGPERMDAFPLLANIEGFLGAVTYRDNGQYLPGTQESEWDIV